MHAVDATGDAVRAQAHAAVVLGAAIVCLAVRVSVQDLLSTVKGCTTMGWLRRFETPAAAGSAASTCTELLWPKDPAA
jgi:hypothetical protein